MFDSISELVKLAEKRNCKVGEVVLEREERESGLTRGELWRKMEARWRVMKDSIEKSLSLEAELPIEAAKGGAKKLLSSKPFFVKGELRKAIARSMAIAEYNASMGRICAAPTAGSSGILPAALYTAMEILNCGEDNIVLSLFTAGGVGLVIAKKASTSGAEAGCQAECGTASAMASAALVELAGGEPKTICDAVAIALKNLLGLICDPVAGLVISPCIKRNAIGVLNAFLSAELALSGVKSVIPCDEVVEAMASVGKALPKELKETGLGGIAATKTALAIKKLLT